MRRSSFHRVKPVTDLDGCQAFSGEVMGFAEGLEFKALAYDCEVFAT